MPNANRGSYCQMIYQGLGNEALDFGLAAPAHEVPCDPVRDSDFHTTDPPLYDS